MWYNGDMGSALQLAGERFGRLLALESVGSYNKRINWRCQCECGAECVVNATDLRNGNTKSCGCLSRERTVQRNRAGRKTDIAPGNRYGRLVVSYEDDGRDGKRRWRCVCDCGLVVSVVAESLRGGNTQSCGCLRREGLNARRGEKHPYWKGGRRPTDCGYIHLRVGLKYVLEHRHVMEQHIGRDLLPKEQVHHINGDRTDNRLENLELWSESHPSGQRVEDKVAHALEILRTYAPEMVRDTVEIAC